MTKESFGKKMKYLNIAYPSFKLDIENQMHLEVWHDILGEFEDEYFNTILKDYVKHNEFAPNSPASLIVHAKKMLLSQIDIGGTFDKLIDRLRKEFYDVELVANRYEKGGNVAVAKTLRELKTNVQTWRNNSDQLPFLKNAFEKTYAEYLMREIDKQVFAITDASRLIGE